MASRSPNQCRSWIDRGLGPLAPGGAGEESVLRARNAIRAAVARSIVVRFTCQTAKLSNSQVVKQPSCQTAKLSNSHAKSSAASVGPAGGRRVSHRGTAGDCPLAKPRGRSAEVAPGKTARPCGGVRVPLAKGTRRPSALRAAAYGRPGSVSRIDGRLLHFRSITGPSSGNRTIGWGLSAPGRSRRRPGRRACEARGRGRRTPLRLQTPPATPSNERGCGNVYIGT